MQTFRYFCIYVLNTFFSLIASETVMVANSKQEATSSNSCQYPGLFYTTDGRYVQAKMSDHL